MLLPKNMQSAKCVKYTATMRLPMIISRNTRLSVVYGVVKGNYLRNKLVASVKANMC
jgi:hypothetical protein